MEYDRNELEAMPSVHQIAKLASSLIMLASRHNALRIDMDSKYRKQYLIEPIIMVGDLPEYRENLRYSRFITANIHRVARAAWDLHYIEGYHMEHAGKVDNGLIQKQNFSWSDSGVLDARRTFRYTKEVTHKKDMYEEIDSFQMADDMASIWDAQIQMEQLTKGDVENTVTDVTRLAQAVNSGILPYRAAATQR